MKYIATIGAMLLILLTLGLVLPSSFSVSREVVIDAPTNIIHQHINDLYRWPDWSPWQEMDPSVKVTIGKVTMGKGAVQHWQDDSGGGQLKFIASDPDKGIEYLIWFGDSPQPAFASMRYHRHSDTITRVSWSLEGELDSPVVGPYLAMMMDEFVGPAFKLGLDNLKREAEREQ